MNHTARKLRRVGELRRAGLAAIACTTLALAGCGSEVTPRAVPEGDGQASSSTAGPTTTSASPTTVVSPPPGQEGEDIGGDVDFDVEIGQCVALGGTQFDATIENAVCGGETSNFKVIAKAPTQTECPSDADQTYYVTYGEVEQGALCLDVDWVVGGCMDLSEEDPVRIDCSAPGSDSYRVTDVLAGTTDVEQCADPATGGFAHDERGFIVCFESL
ncbi:MAG: hypothetical protein WBQ44_07955 [Rhodococcus sp. (in: high G+C Gram-positive bacteria)]